MSDQCIICLDATNTVFMCIGCNIVRGICIKCIINKDENKYINYVKNSGTVRLCSHNCFFRTISYYSIDSVKYLLECKNPFFMQVQEEILNKCNRLRIFNIINPLILYDVLNKLIVRYV